MMEPPARRGGHPGGQMPSLADMDFNQTPFIVFWETTRACALACRHCRATAQPRRHPEELTSEEGFRLIGEIKSFGNPLFVITGGDPMMRPDLYDLIRYGDKVGLRVSLAPSATALVTKEALRKAKDAGVKRISFSLDGSTAEVHDAFRQTKGAFERMMRILQWTKEVGIALQVNTTLSRYNKDDLPAIARLVGEAGAVLWSVFCLVPTGRGLDEDMVSPQEHEDAFNLLYDISKTVPFDVKTTAAENYRRVVVQRKMAESGLAEGSEVRLQLARPGFDSGDGISRAAKGVNDGNGCCFISHTGEVYPSGFLPVVAGNVRTQSLLEIYRNSPIFRDLRDVSKLKGKCGRCEYNKICGGSRARAYAVTGDYLAAEPYCVYQPARPTDC
ncbi:MAG: TIGR04053 family radical SAM/SPASM domain-containing protein [Chloroflexi bacterium]|nr:TIGR04053 family radical SAM/SPASM domain-containing protein [Chloroflexota bacterium]